MNDEFRRRKILAQNKPLYLAVGWTSDEETKEEQAAAVNLLDPRGRRVLDLGCGYGAMIDYLWQRKPEERPSAYLGVERMEELVSLAEERIEEKGYNAPQRPVRVVQADAIEFCEKRRGAFEIAYAVGLASMQEDLDVGRFLRALWNVTTLGFYATFLNEDHPANLDLMIGLHAHDPGFIASEVCALTPRFNLDVNAQVSLAAARLDVDTAQVPSKMDISKMIEDAADHS